MPESAALLDGRVVVGGLSERAAVERRGAIAHTLEQFELEDVAALRDTLRGNGPTLFARRLDSAFVAHVWLGWETAVWATPVGEDDDRLELTLTSAGRVPALVASMLGLRSNGNDGQDELADPIVLASQELRVWCAEERAAWWRMRVAATDDPSPFELELVVHPELGPHAVARYERGGASAVALFPAGARFLWRVLLAVLAEKLSLSAAPT